MLMEQQKCGVQMSVWIIEESGAKKGVITARYSKAGKATHVTLEIDPFIRIAPGRVKVLNEEERVSGYEKVNGTAKFESDKSEFDEYASEGIGKILMRHRETLKEYYGIKIPEAGMFWKWYGWTKVFEGNGYGVIRVL